MSKIQFDPSDPGGGWGGVQRSTTEDLGVGGEGAEVHICEKKFRGKMHICKKILRLLPW